MPSRRDNQRYKQFSLLRSTAHRCLQSVGHVRGGGSVGTGWTSSNDGLVPPRPWCQTCFGKEGLRRKGCERRQEHLRRSGTPLLRVKRGDSKDGRQEVPQRSSLEVPGGLVIV